MAVTAECAPVSGGTGRWAECACGCIFTGRDVTARRDAHILSGEGNILAGLLGGSSWDDPLG